MSWIPPLCAGVALYAGAALIQPPVVRDPAALPRHLARPLVLPFAWRGLCEAMQRGDLGAAVGRGRTLLRLLPEWADGHLYFAGLLAYEATQRETDPEAKLDRLLAALAVLDEAETLTPRHLGQFLLAKAFFVEHGTSRDPELAAAFRDRVGKDPLEFAAQQLERAKTLAPGTEARDQHAYLTERMIRLAFDAGDLERALRLTELAQRLLADVRAEAHAAGEPQAGATAEEHHASLQRLRRKLSGDPTLTWGELERDPILEDLIKNRPR